MIPRHETLSEARSEADPTKDTRTGRKSLIGAALGANSAPPCPHCRTTLRHTDRIGCCSGCKRVFTSTSAHDAHRTPLACKDPLEAGLQEKTMQGYPVYGWPRGNVVWDTTRQER